MTLKEIQIPVAEHLKEFNKYFKETMKSNVSLLDLIIRYMTKKKGKQVRPLMVFLAADLCGGITQRAYIGASMVELLHTATLIHDDVVDEASERRGLATINSSWNNKIAVLIGDFLLGKGLLTAVDKDEFEFLRTTSNTVRRMSEGELLQIQKSMDFILEEETYFRIISDKTASLISACCEIGAISASDNAENRQKMRDYGENVGIAFQIRDDIFDYQSKSSLIGKPVGNDLKEKKVTLPLLYSLNQVSKAEAKRIIKMIKNGKLAKSEIIEIAEFVRDKGGISYAEEKAREFSRKALEALSEFPDSPSKKSLAAFVDFVITREK